MPVRLKDAPKSQRTRMQHAEWLGNSTALIIVTDNDIYLRQSPADEEDFRLTHTGVPGLIYNGITDWLYQGEHLSSEYVRRTKLEPPFFAEEIFKSQKAMWGSNDGSMLLYATFNDTNVGQMMYPWFSSNPLIQSGEYCRFLPPNGAASLYTPSTVFLSSVCPTAGGLTSKGSFPESRSIRYPTPGTFNPEVTLWLLDLSNLTDVQKYWIKEPISLEGQ